MPRVKSLEREEELRPVDRRDISTDVGGDAFEKTRGAAEKVAEDVYEKGSP